MPVRIIQEVISLISPLVEPLPMASEPPPCYPWPELRQLDVEQETEVLIIRLENEFVSVAIAPSLGGRIVELIDRRSEKPIIALPSRIVLEEGGVQGLTWSHGIRFQPCDRWANELGPVDFRLIEPAEAESKGAIFLFDWQGDLSVHTALTLAPDAGEMLIEQIVYNRSWLSEEVALGWNSDRDSRQILLGVESGADAGIAFLGAHLEGRRVGAPRQRLGGHRSLSWSTRALCYSGLRGNRSHSRKASISVDGRTIHSVVHGPGSAKLLLSAGGQTFESPLAEQPTKPVSTDVSALGEVSGIAVRLESGELVASWPKLEPGETALPPQSDLWNRLDDLITGKAAPDFYLREPGGEPYGYWNRVLAAVSNQDVEQVNANLDKLLSFNAEDPLTWWLKSAATRELDWTEEDSPALPNAHFLAPLEPLLKAEAFLNMPIPEGRDQNPLLTGIADDPPRAAAVVGAYYAVGLFRSMARLADEFLRQRDNALIHYLMAMAHLRMPNGRVAAAEHVRAAGRLPFAPPWPSRSAELEAISALAREFPEDARIRDLSELAYKAGQLGAVALG